MYEAKVPENSEDFEVITVLVTESTKNKTDFNAKSRFGFLALTCLFVLHNEIMRFIIFLSYWALSVRLSSDYCIIGSQFFGLIC